MADRPSSSYVFPPVGWLFTATKAELEELALNRIEVDGKLVAWLAAVFVHDSRGEGAVMKYVIIVELDAPEMETGRMYEVREAGLLSQVHHSDFLHHVWKQLGTGLLIQSSHVLNLLRQLKIVTNLSLPWQKKLGLRKR